MNFYCLNHYTSNDQTNFPRLGGVYAIYNFKSDKIYVGSSIPSQGFKKRWKNHIKSLSEGKHSNIHLQNAVNKYGIEQFIFVILEIVDTDNKKIVCEKEQFWMGCYTQKYNIAPIAGNTFGVKRSKENVEKMTKRKREYGLQSNNSSGCVGVTRATKYPVWQSSITCANISIFLGYYDKIEDAIDARKQSERVFWDKEFLKKPIEEQRDFINDYKNKLVSKSNSSGHKYIAYCNKKTARYIVSIPIDNCNNPKFVGSYVLLEDAVKAKEEFLALTTENQVNYTNKVCGIDLIEENIYYSETIKLYIVRYDLKKSLGRFISLKEAQENKKQLIEKYLKEKEEKGQTSKKEGIDKRRKSGTGIYVFKNKWRAQIRGLGKLITLGVFATYEEALEARLAAEKIYWK